MRCARDYSYRPSQDLLAAPVLPPSTISNVSKIAVKGDKPNPSLPAYIGSALLYVTEITSALLYSQSWLSKACPAQMRDARHARRRGGLRRRDTQRLVNGVRLPPLHLQLLLKRVCLHPGSLELYQRKGWRLPFTPTRPACSTACIPPRALPICGLTQYQNGDVEKTSKPHKMSTASEFDTPK